MPLLCTQETWLHGRSVSPVVILAGVIVAFAANVVLSYFVGFRPGRTHRPTEDAVVGMGCPSCSPHSCSCCWTGSGRGDIAGERARTPGGTVRGSIFD